MNIKPLSLADYNLIAPRVANPVFARVARLPRARDWVFTAPDHWRMTLTDEYDWPLAIGGLLPLWPGRAEAWLLLAVECGLRDTLTALHYCAEHLDRLQASDPACRRIEMWVEANAPWRARFAERLGMHQEGYAEGWGIEGDDYVLYARVAPPLAQARAA